METVSSTFLLIGIIITLAAFLGAWSSFLKQPIFIAYILAGVIAGPLILQNQGNLETFNLLRDLGLSFVLFLVGLDLKTGNLRRFGLVAIQTGLKQVIIVLIITMVVARLIGFPTAASFYIGIALAFSSTIVAVKLLTEKRDFDSLYGELTISILLLQDLLAIFTLIIISSFGKTGGVSPSNLFLSVLVGSVLIGVGYFLNRGVLPYIFDRIAYNTELLFIGSLAWLFIVAAAASFAGFSIEIGAFLAGVGLANLPEEHQIAARVRPLRDFFILMFFILVGARMGLSQIPGIILPALVLSALILVLKPLVIMFFLSREGFRKRTGFMTGVAIAQVSEFSLVLLFLGQKLGQVEEKVVGLVTLVALITIAASSYGLTHATKIYRFISKYLDIFEPRKRIEQTERVEELSDHFVLIGAGRLGWDILQGLKKHDKKVLVIEFNPAIAEKLKEEGTEVLFGDIADPEIQKQSGLDRAEMIISTIFDPEDTGELLNLVKTFERKVPLVATAATESQGLDFYREGATYVIIPRVISSKVFSSFLTPQRLEDLMDGGFRAEQIEELSERLKVRLIS